MPLFEFDLIPFKTDPGHITRTVRNSAHTAMAMRTPLAWKFHGKTECSAEAAAINFCVACHCLLNDDPSQPHPYCKQYKATEYKHREAVHNAVVGDMYVTVNIP